MVDVGYFINGKHGVIKNVIPMANTKTEHLCFMQGEEQYALKKEHIEYVIPSEKVVFDKDGIIEYNTDGSVVVQCSKNLLPPMTFADKFKEVFGFEPNRSWDICDSVNCDCREDCNGCIYDIFHWDDTYVKAEVGNGN